MDIAKLDAIAQGIAKLDARITAHQSRMDAEWNEGDHPRDELGQFSSTGLGSTSHPWTKSQSKNAEYASGLLKKEGFKSEVYRKPGTAAAAMWSNGTVYLNASHSHWKDPAESSKRSHTSGQLSTDHPLGVLYHEIGHHKYDPPDNFFGGPYGPHGEAAKTVSKYAGRNPKEFVSEVYAGLMSGRSYPPEVMRLFREYAKPRK